MFYVLEISTYNNDTPTAKAVYSYETHDEALATFYQKMRGAIVNNTYASELCIIFNDHGLQLRNEYWERQTTAE